MGFTLVIARKARRRKHDVVHVPMMAMPLLLKSMYRFWMLQGDPPPKEPAPENHFVEDGDTLITTEEYSSYLSWHANPCTGIAMHKLLSNEPVDVE